MPKKKKYKIVPNNFTSPPLAHNSISSITSSALNAPTSKVAVDMTDNELPKDRKDLLKFVSQSTFLEYNSLAFLKVSFSSVRTSLLFLSYR